jgi:hypothetical protein
MFFWRTTSILCLVSGTLLGRTGALPIVKLIPTLMPALLQIQAFMFLQSQQSDLNRRPSDYKSDALPLCYAGKLYVNSKAVSMIFHCHTNL